MGEGMRGEPDPAIAGGRAKKGGHEGEWNSVPGPLSALAQSKAWPDAYPKKGENGVPESVDKLTIVVDSWGSNDLNPWNASQAAMDEKISPCPGA